MNKLGFIITSLIVLLAVASSMLFVVDQRQFGVVYQLGQIKQVVTEPGLNFKLPPPFQNVTYIDKRLLTLESQDSEPTLTAEKQRVVIDWYVRWRITDPLKFLQSVRDEAGARTRLDDIIDSVTRDIVSGTELEEIVRSADWQVDAAALEAVAQEAVVREDTTLEKPKKGRARLEQEMLASASRLMPDMGIELVDVRIKRINYIDTVRSQVESRMISERQSIAARFRSEGQGKSQEILGNMEKELRGIRGEIQIDVQLRWIAAEQDRTLPSGAQGRQIDT